MVIRATMYLPVSWIELTSSVFLGESVTQLSRRGRYGIGIIKIQHRPPAEMNRSPYIWSDYISLRTSA